MRKSISKVASQPLVQFLVLGAIVYALWVWIWGPGAVDDEKTIVVTAADVSRLDASWRARWNRPPTDQELLGLVRKSVREIALYRHAVAMGLDKNDPTIRRMVGNKLQTLTQGLVELNLSPTDQELRTYFEANVERYRPPDLITFTQVFVDPDKRGDATLDDAEDILVELRSLAEPTEGTEAFGDQFMLQRYYPQKDGLEIRKLFGQGFTQSVFKLEPGRWHGPVLSGYGVHLVYVHHLGKAPAPEFEMVQEEVKQQWMDEKGRELQQEYINEVLAGYEVVFEDFPDEPSDEVATAGPEASE
jgi:peptidyl-prolyl cis-trans isomerase C